MIPGGRGPRRRLTAQRGIGVCHISHSRQCVPDPPDSVGEPRHYLVFGVGHEGIVDILGFVHERMLLGRALGRIVREHSDNI